MNMGAYIVDQNLQTQFSILTDRSRGATSLGNGQLENMMQRRLLYDDGRGVGEPLNEPAPMDVIRTKELVLFDTFANASQQFRTNALLFNNEPILLFSSAVSIQNWSDNYKTSFAPLLQDLPPNVHLLDLKTLPTGQVILRLTHIYAVGEDPVYSQPVTLDLNSIFANLAIVEITEMTMTANQPLVELKRLNWNTDTKAPTPKFVPLQNGILTLNPMDTRTFLVRFQNV